MRGLVGAVRNRVYARLQSAAGLRPSHATGCFARGRQLNADPFAGLLIAWDFANTTNENANRTWLFKPGWRPTMSCLQGQAFRRASRKAAMTGRTFCSFGTMTTGTGTRLP